MKRVIPQAPNTTKTQPKPANSKRILTPKYHIRPGLGQNFLIRVPKERRITAEQHEHDDLASKIWAPVKRL